MHTAHVLYDGPLDGKVLEELRCDYRIRTNHFGRLHLLIREPAEDFRTLWYESGDGESLVDGIHDLEFQRYVEMSPEEWHLIRERKPR